MSHQCGAWEDTDNSGGHEHVELHVVIHIYRNRPIKRTVQVEVGKIFCRRDVGNLLFTAHLNDCQSEHIGRYCTFALSLLSLLRRLAHVKRLLIGQ